MDKIKYENVGAKYKHIGEFNNDCEDKNILLGAFYIDDIYYEYNRRNSYTDSNNSVTIYYSVFDPIKHNITQKVISLAIGENERLDTIELNEIIQGYEYREFHYYIKRHHKNSKINCVNEIFEVEYL